LHFAVLNLQLGGEEILDFVKVDEPTANSNKMAQPENGSKEERSLDKRVEMSVALRDKGI